ncbi:MAG: stage II sporulation protein P [Eubacteriales bacterium]|nr:stage II sporulation protein P [Eubacteriales bacterium]
MISKISHRRRPARRNKLLLFTLLFWGICGMATLVFLNMGIGVTGQDLREEVGKQYLANAFPLISRSNGTESRDFLSETENREEKTVEVAVTGKEVIDTETHSVSSEKPQVLIYHTHATETFQPVSEGNFHSQDEEGTVREVGNVLEAALKAKGIGVVHNKTLHDSPSYSKSYSRSMDTAQSILKSNPSIQIIIDLHRDAAGYTGNKGHTFIVDGKTAAQFSLVVGRGNDNAKELMIFANKIIAKANELYPGFSRGIIQKEYKYNQYITDQYLLLEMGNNQNTIEEAKCSATYFAEALAQVMEEM